MGRAGYIGFAVAAAAGCSFPGNPADDDGGDDIQDGAVVDGPVDAVPGPDARPADARPPDARCMIGSIDACGMGPPDAALQLFGVISTDVDPRCRTYQQPSGGAPACLIFAEGIVIPAASTLQASGSRPLVLASTMDIAINGVLDVSSRRGGPVGAAANDAACNLSQQAQDDSGGAAGAAGGAFGGPGGNGGTGDSDTTTDSDGSAQPGVAGGTVTVSGYVRGGCRGGDGGDTILTAGGSGGDSGGAVWLAAIGTVSVGSNGAIRATGAGAGGGQPMAGGGGGGSGGMILVEAPIIDVDGDVSANAGGGGEGGHQSGLTPVNGNPGENGDLGTTAAQGGRDAPGPAGFGGNGTGGSDLSGEVGGNSTSGGGGGGGGAGIIQFSGSVTGGGTVSPPPT